MEENNQNNANNTGGASKYTYRVTREEVLNKNNPTNNTNTSQPNNVQQVSPQINTAKSQANNTKQQVNNASTNTEKTNNPQNTGNANTGIDKLLEAQKNIGPVVKQKKLSRRKKMAIGTATGLILTTTIAAPLAYYVYINNPVRKPFELTVVTSYEDKDNHEKTFVIKPGTKIKELKAIKEEGYVFKGYYKDPECTQPYDPEYVITKEDKVYALLEYEVFSFVSTFYYNGEEKFNISLDTSMTIEDAYEIILTKLNKTDEEFKTYEGGS